MSTVDIPKVGAVDKRALIGVGLVAAGFVAWRFYAAGSGADSGDAVDSTGSEFGEDAGIPGVLNAVDSGNRYGRDDGDQEPESTDQYGFHGTTNSQWTQYAAGQLAQSDRWSYTDVVEALGNYLAGRPLTSLQQTIVQAAIAVAGYPPVGTHSIVPGGDSKLTIAPQGLRVASKTGTSVTLTFSPVAGAAGYRAYRSGAGSNVGGSTDTTIVVSGLTPATSYTFHVRAVSSAGSTGPSSASVKATTEGVKLQTASKPHVSSVTKTTAHVSTAKVEHATGYRWYLNGNPHGASDSTAYTLSGLKPRTSYSVTVRADTATGAPGPASPPARFRTK